MAAPRQISSTGDSITITWSELDSSSTNGQDVQSYRIGYQECTDNTFTSCEAIVYTKEALSCLTSSGSVAEDSSLKTSCDNANTLYDITGLASNKWYSISIAAKNTCGLGEPSVVLKENTKNCPSQVANLKTINDGANVDVVWDTQASVDSYEVLFQKVDGSWTRLSECQDANI